MHTDGTERRPAECRRAAGPASLVRALRGFVLSERSGAWCHDGGPDRQGVGGHGGAAAAGGAARRGAARHCMSLAGCGGRLDGRRR